MSHSCPTMWFECIEREAVYNTLANIVSLTVFFERMREKLVRLFAYVQMGRTGT